MTDNPCISADAKDLILEAFPENVELAKFLTDDMATCAVEKEKPKRALSPYNVFIGDCLKAQGFGDAGAKMKRCAQLWREKQGAAA